LYDLAELATDADPGVERHHDREVDVDRSVAASTRLAALPPDVDRAPPVT
jgi:hypothetical protein